MKKHGAYLILSLLITVSIQAAVLEVPSSYSTIQLAVTAASNGDTVLVSPGTYTEYINFIAKDVDLISTDGAEQTIIEAVSPFSHIIQYNNINYPTTEYFPVLKGFTLRNTSGDGDTRAITIWGVSPEITENIFTNNGSSLFHNVIYAVSSNAVVHHNIFYKNNANCVVANNNPVDSVIVYNNTFHENSRCVSDVHAFHNIFSMTVNLENTTWADSGYNNVFRMSYPFGYPDSTTRFFDPQFLDTANADFHILPTSQVINAGNPSFKEIDNSIIDIGRYTTADSSLPLANEIHFTPVVDTTMVKSLSPDIIWSYWDTAATSQTQLQIQVGTDNDWSVAEIWNSGIINNSNSNYAYNGPSLSDRSLYYIRIRLNNGSGFGEWKDTSFFTNLSPVSFSVPSEYSTIQSAIDIALNDDTILFQPGIYVSDFDNLGKRLHYVSSGGADLTTVVASSPSLPVFAFENSPSGGVTVIDGFTIKDGSLGISAKNGTYEIKNNIVENNQNSSSPLPGGILLENSTHSIIEHNIIRDNITSFFGGAMVINDSFEDTIRYNVIYNNTGDPEIRVLQANDIVFYNNTVDIGNGDGYYHGTSSGTSSLYNNIFINATGAGIRAPASGSQIIYSAYNLFFNNTSEVEGVGINSFNALSLDPNLTDPVNENYNLLVISPCIDNGDPNSFFNDPDGSRNDIGAIPFDSLQAYYLELLAPTPPFSAGIIYDMSPVFIWSSSIDLDTEDTIVYSFYLDTQLDLSTAMITDSLTDTTISLLDSLEFHSPYYWKIVAYDQNGFENETGINTFYTWTLGDVNNSKTTDIADLVFFVSYAFDGGPSFTPTFIGDVNADCIIDIADIVRMVDFMFGDTGTQLDPGCE